MRPSHRQWSFWFIVLVVLGFFIFYVGIPTLRDNSSCSTVTSSNGDAESVAVPIGQIMRGEPILLEQNDPRIIEYILKNGHIEPPSSKPYNLKETEEDPSRGQGQYIRKLLNNQEKGFFVECGALDGETRSNTLYMEKNQGWKGLLVEGDPSNYDKMKKKHRKAWTSNTCLAVKPYPHQATFLPNFNIGKIIGVDSETDSKQTEKRVKRAGKTVKVQCMPLFSLLSALNVTTVDYFSLDVEGNELQVLKTIPFDKITIKTLSVEYIHTEEGKAEILEFMRSKGYNLHGEVHFRNNLANDVILVHESLNL